MCLLVHRVCLCVWEKVGGEGARGTEHDAALVRMRLLLAIFVSLCVYPRNLLLV